MKISREWLQTYFEKELPSAEAFGEALTFHAFEIDGIEKVGEDAVLDVKVTPNRGHDCLCHRGIAKELSAILELPLGPEAAKTLRSISSAALPSDSRSGYAASERVRVSIDTPLCSRYIAGYLQGVTVRPSPQWLKARLEALGQRSINNIVDATNYVMFDLSQPLHAFDAGKLAQKDDSYAIVVRAAKSGEKMLALDEKEYALSESMLVIADANKDEAIGVAGVKGGMPAGISETTRDIIIESANFDGASVRKTAQALKLRTDASQRFEQVLSPELAACGMQAVIELIQKIAGGTVAGITDAYPKPQKPQPVSVTTTKVKQVLGGTFGEKEIKDAFGRLGFSYRQNGEEFVIDAPFERLDLGIPEDLVEEVGRIIGYDHVPAIELPPFPKQPEVNKNFAAAEKMREELVSQGYSEVFTSVFADRGERVVLNKVDGVRPYLRSTLVNGLADALAQNWHNQNLLGLEEVRLFEIGKVWKDGKEITMLGMADDKKGVREAPLAVMEVDAYEMSPLSTAERYQPFSRFPYIVRDVALWTPTGTGEKEVAELIKAEAGKLCIRISLFDTFTKGEKTSLAYRLIFQSFDRTLTDAEANAAMERVYTTLRAQGFEIR